MTRKDILLLATALHEALKTEIELFGENYPTSGGIRVAARRIADSIKVVNPAFNTNHFMLMVRGERELGSVPDRLRQPKRVKVVA